MVFALITPLREPGGSTSEAGGSEAGSAGSRRSNVEIVLKEQLDKAPAEVYKLREQLGEARAQVAAGTEIRELAVKFAALEAKHAAQAEISVLQVEHQSLLDVIASMKLEWAQRKALEALAVASAAAGRDASTPGAASAPEAPGLSPTPSQAEPRSAPGLSAPATSTTPPTPGAASAPEAPGLSPTPSRAEPRSDSGPGPFSTTSGPVGHSTSAAADQAADPLVDSWALSRAAAAKETQKVCDFQAPSGEPTDGAYAPLKDLHPKDIPPPARTRATARPGSSGARGSAATRFPAAIGGSFSSWKGSSCCAEIQSRWLTRRIGRKNSTLCRASRNSRSASIRSSKRAQAALRAWSSFSVARIACVRRLAPARRCGLLSARGERFNPLLQNHEPAVPRPRQGAAGVHDEMGA